MKWEEITLSQFLGVNGKQYKRLNKLTEMNLGKTYLPSALQYCNRLLLLRGTSVQTLTNL